MIGIKELELYLNQLLPSDRLSDFALNGLQVEGKAQIKTIATAVSASLETLEAAVDAGVDALIVHHGIFWQRDSFAVVGTKRKKLALLLSQNISLFAYHLPLDLHPEIGNNWVAAKELGLQNLEPFGAMGGINIGVKGQIEPQCFEEFQKKLELYYSHASHSVQAGEKKISTVGLISGGAYKSIGEAAAHGLDAFITGSFDEPVWHQAKEEGIHFFAMGHSATERVGPIALAKRLTSDLKMPAFFIDKENPF